MKRILFLTNIASPYRVAFFDQLGKEMDVTVLLSDRSEGHKTRSVDWFTEGQGGFHKVQLQKRVLSSGEEDLCLDVIDWLKKPFDAIILGGYSSPTLMLAIAYLKLTRKPFYMEVDGGLVREESRGKYLFKRLLVSSADRWISSGPFSTDYLVHYGAKRERVSHYPFTSLWEKDILSAVPSAEEKMTLRRKLGMPEGKILLYVGRFLKEKGMDDLLYAAPQIAPGTHIYFIGGEPAKEHLDFCAGQKLGNVHFVGFTKKEALLDYYQAADLLVLPTWSDVWGLVVNEAMACGLPVVTTDKCVAGVELVKEGVNGAIVPAGDREALARGINSVLSGDLTRMGAAALETIRPYTIENMAKAHVEILENRR